MSKQLQILKPKAYEFLLGDKQVALSYDLNAFALLEEEYGSIEEAFARMQGAEGKGVKIKDTLNFLRAGLISSCPDITNEEIGACLNASNVPILMEYISGAVQSSLPSQDEVEATPEAKN